MASTCKMPSESKQVSLGVPNENLLASLLHGTRYGRKDVICVAANQTKKVEFERRAALEEQGGGENTQ